LKPHRFYQQPHNLAQVVTRRAQYGAVEHGAQPEFDERLTAMVGRHPVSAKLRYQTGVG
jgi:hypothetical protein